MREEVLLRKLMADGDGTGEERRFHLMLSSLQKALRGEGPSTAAEAARALKHLEAAELCMHRQSLQAKMNVEQVADYVALEEEVEKEMLRVADSMEAAKRELAEAKLIRKNRQEYDALATLINQVPSRDSTERKLQDIREELVAQQERQKILEAKLAERRTKLQAFNAYLLDFQKFINDDDDAVEAGGVEESPRVKEQSP